MGAIRKTASISTLGLVNFRSKKERLARAETARDAEHLAREVAENSFTRVETELRRLTGAEAKAARQLSRLKRSRKLKRASRLEAMLATATPAVEGGVAKAKTHGRRARRVAKRASHEVRVGAEHAIDQARTAMQSS